MLTINYQDILPQHPLPVCIIGAGGIVNDAHLPAYRLAGFTVAAIFDVNPRKAMDAAEKFAIPNVYNSLQQMLEVYGKTVVYDLAVPGNALLPLLKQLPRQSFVLMQKPMGINYSEAQEILAVCRDRGITAAVNFQLRYAPYINAARTMIGQGLIGSIHDVEVNINVHTPWDRWEFLFSSPRVEILYHSIHYIDLIRNFMGNPKAMYAKTVKHPAMHQLASVRSNIIMDYGDMVRANIITNHGHVYGLEKQHAYIKLEGSKGAIKITLGSLMNYPAGVDDAFEYVILDGSMAPVWHKPGITGSWFPHAFIGSMAQVMRAAEGSIETPGNSVEDCVHTMACVEAAYISAESGQAVMVG